MNAIISLSKYHLKEDELNIILPISERNNSPGTDILLKKEENLGNIISKLFFILKNNDMYKFLSKINNCTTKKVKSLLKKVHQFIN